MVLIIVDEAAEDSMKMPLTEDNHVIKTLATDRANQSLHKWILPRRAWSDEFFLDAKTVHAPNKFLAVDSVAVPDQILWSGVLGERVDDLLSMSWLRP